ncbi:hypothetical protein K523DRAFT_155213 [Schizophyllum commune Tattone D]|nr:hypothetical protein K523DRAFT_155213 [Schizophyllum commune Tattone D]
MVRSCVAQLHQRAPMLRKIGLLSNLAPLTGSNVARLRQRAFALPGLSGALSCRPIRRRTANRRRLRLAGLGELPCAYSLRVILRVSPTGSLALQQLTGNQPSAYFTPGSLPRKSSHTARHRVGPWFRGPDDVRSTRRDSRGSGVQEQETDRIWAVGRQVVALEGEGASGVEGDHEWSTNED